MSLLNQKTLNEAVTFKGIGLHSGKVSTVNILPSGTNTGIIIRRTDIKKNNTIVPSIFNVSEANYCTTVSNEYGIKVSTIEHLMAALFIKGIDNAIIEINGEEVPILDGSSVEFVKKIENAGIKTSEFFFRLSDLIAISNAAVPFETAIPYFFLLNFEKSFSNFFTKFPSEDIQFVFNASRTYFFS